MPKGHSLFDFYIYYYIENNKKMETAKINEIYPVHAFYTVSVAIESEPDDKGKSKKSKETYLVDAEDVSDAEAKTISLMECVNGTWEIESVAKAKISGVVTEA